MQQQIFNSPIEMLELLKKDIDLYNIETGEYVFKYTEEGSLAVYVIDINTAKELAEIACENREYWGSQLGPGGCVYDNPSPECSFSNLYYCTKSFNAGKWFKTDDLQLFWDSERAV